MKKITFYILSAILFSLSSQAQPCLSGGITISSQQTIDSFNILYPGCTEIEGDLKILYGSDITSLSGLTQITSIKGSLLIVDNDQLSSLSGLDNLQSISGGLGIVDNDMLTDLGSLSQLTSISGNLTIGWNQILKNLTGLDHIISESIQNLYVYFNDSLCNCAVESVCNYLANPGGAADISINALGCNSNNEVNQACETIGIEESNRITATTLFPNPARTEVYILTPDNCIIKHIRVYNISGKEIKITGPSFKCLNISPLESGIYFLEITMDNTRITRKLVID